MSDLLLSEGATNKANEADHFAFLISDVAIPDGTPRLDVVASLADAGIYTTEGLGTQSLSPPKTLHRALRRMAGPVFLLVFWVLAGACQRHGVGGSQIV